ncbi:MAG TPA: ATP-dependent DNA helicase [Candidatus Dormibacteraeota bacterium]|nr:ATP-dependent DNA helicase [Candidatus Dormibacteraeota bacterium]
MASLPPDVLERPARLLAGPGAGKTQALVDLYADLVEGGRAGREQILVLTFSTAAARELAERLDERLRDSYGQCYISTFHSFCARLMREWGDPGLLLMSGFQEWVAMRATLEAMDRGELGDLAAIARSDGFAQDALAFVALLKQNLVHPGHFGLLAEAAGTPRLRALARVFSAYQARLEAAGLRDFRDLVRGAIELLESRPAVLERLRAGFRYVLVDEFQDVDPAQFHLLRMLAPPPGGREPGPTLLVAGDPDQSIYGFRGAVPRLLAEDVVRIYAARTLELGVSHRCPEAVLEAGRRLLEATQPGRAPRTLTGTPDGGGEVVRVVREATAADEAFFVAREIRRLMLERPGLRPRDFAVLLRSTATLAAPFEEAARAMGLPYEVRGLATIGRNEIVRFLLAYLRALRRPEDPESLERLLASELSGVDRRTASRLRRHAVEQGRSLVRVVRRLVRWLHEVDPARYPLPEEEVEAELPLEVDGGGPPPAERAAAPMDFVRYLTPEELDAFHRAMVTFSALRRRASQLPLDALAYAVAMEAGILERALAVPLAENERRERLGELRVALDAFRQLTRVWERLHGSPPTLDDVGSRLETWIVRAVDEVEPAPGGGDAVQIMTVHQAKGLQFEVVFVSGFARGLFPLAGRPHPLLDEADQRWLLETLDGFRPSWASSPGEHVAEEARLAYVAMTRARRRLYVTYADRYDGPAGPSPFCDLALTGAPRSELTRAPARLEVDSVLTLGEAETLLVGARLEDEQRRRLAALGVDLDFVTDPEAGRVFEPHRQPPEQVDPSHFSATAINDYLKCPRLYWYNHHPGLAAPPRGVELERGSFLHRVLEEFHRREPEWRHLEAPLQREWLERVLRPHLEAYLSRVESVLDRRTEEQHVRRILDNYVRFATSLQPIRRLGTLMVERRFTLRLDGAEIHGKIDRVNDTGEGTCEVVDYKTGRGKTAQQAYEESFGEQPMDVQLVVYYLACREGVDEEGRPIALRPRFLSLWYPRDTVRGEMRQVLFPVDAPAPGVSEWMQRPIDEADVERGRAVVMEAIRRIRAGDFSPAPRPVIGTCLSWYGCPHAMICPFGGQPGE